MLFQQPKKSTLSSKKEQFRRQIRVEQLNRYMKKIRIEIQDNQQYHGLKNVIDSLYCSEFFQGGQASYLCVSEKNSRRMHKLKELANYANQGKNSAIVAIAELLLTKKVTIQMLQSLTLYDSSNTEDQNLQNTPHQSNDIMKVLKFPEKQSEGWLALIRVLLNLNYCTEEMIYYCLKAIAKNKELQAIEFALQVVYILVIDQRMIKIQQLIDLILAKSSETAEFTDSPDNSPQKMHQSTNLPLSNILINFFQALMKFSLKSSILEQSKEITYYSTKILCRCFESETVLSSHILKNVSLERIIEFVNEKFSIRQLWQQTKALKIFNDLLMGLKDKIIDDIIEFDKLMQLMKRAMKELHKLLEDLQLNKQSMIGYSHHSNHLLQTNSLQKQKHLMKYIEENVYFIEIIIENYLFIGSISRNNDFLAQILEGLRIQIVLDKLHDLYGEQVSYMKEGNIESSEYQMNIKLTEEDYSKIWIIQSVQRLAKEFAKQLINQKNNNFSSFLRVILVRLKYSSLKRILNSLEIPGYQSTYEI